MSFRHHHIFAAQTGNAAVPILVALLVGIALGAGAMWWLLKPAPQQLAALPKPAPLPVPASVRHASADLPKPSVTAATVNPDKKRTLGAVKEILANETDGSVLYEHAQAYVSQGQIGPSFLLYRAAARAGSGEAAIAIGRMYDPVDFASRVSPFEAPNADKALEWYQTAKKLRAAGAKRATERTLSALKVEASGGNAEAAALLKKYAQ